MRRFDTVCSHRLNLAFDYYFEYSKRSLRRPYTVRRKGQSAVVQLRFVGKIHVNMCRAPYIGTYLFDLCLVGGLTGDAKWLRVTYLNNFRNQYWRPRYNSP